MKVYRTKSEQGSVLILALLSIVVFFVLATAFLMIAQQHLKMQEKESNRATAFYRAERGINAVVNLLMRDGDDDFRTAGEKKPPLSPNTVPYAFDFSNVNFQVDRLDTRTNPISDVIDKNIHVEEMFETKKDSIWIKVTGFYYPRDEYNKTKIETKDEDYMKQIIKRTVIVRLSKFPLDAFDYAFYTCNDMKVNGSTEVSGPIWVGGTLDVVETPGPHGQHFEYDTSGSTISDDPDDQAKCFSYLQNIQAWGETLCSDPNTIKIPSGTKAGNDKYPGGTILCCEGDLKITGGLTLLDTDLAGTNYIGPSMLIVKGNLDIQGNVEVHGLIMTFGDFLGEDGEVDTGDEDTSHVSGSAGSQGSIISLQDLWLSGGNGLELEFKDYGDFGYGRAISTSKWRETWDKFYVERGGTTYTIEVEDVAVPTPDDPVID
ncbi:hypothetical protein KAU33_11890 [Candidatus Dependentiae bacterium]|nr:hypothetical protein [Candidatus Dependentiae bacterium]